VALPFAFVVGDWWAEAAALVLHTLLNALVFDTVRSTGGFALLGGLDVNGNIFGGTIFGGTDTGGDIFGGCTDVGGDIFGGRTVGHSTGFGDAVAGTRAIDPLGFGPFFLGTGGAAGVSVAGGWCAEAATPKLPTLLFATAAAGSGAPRSSPEAEAASLTSVVSVVSSSLLLSPPSSMDKWPRERGSGSS